MLGKYTIPPRPYSLLVLAFSVHLSLFSLTQMWMEQNLVKSLHMMMADKTFIAAEHFNFPVLLSVFFFYSNFFLFFHYITNTLWGRTIHL